MSLKLFNGEQFDLKISLNIDGKGITPNVVSKIEFHIGEVSKNYPGGVKYDEALGVWLFPLTSEETESFKGNVKAQHRVFFNEQYNKDVLITEPFTIRVESFI